MYLIKKCFRFNSNIKNNIQDNFNLRKTYFYRHFCSNSDLIDVLDEDIKNDRLFEELKAKQFECLATNVEQMKKIESILYDYEYIKYSTLEVPTTLNLKQMSQLLELDSEDRNKYLSHLYKSEIKSLVQKRHQEIRKTLKKQELDQKWRNSSASRAGAFDKNGDIVYGLWHNSLFTRISSQYLRRYSNNKLQTAALFGQNIVFDLTCDESMNSGQCMSKFRQIVQCYTTNRMRFKEPFNLNFSNLNKNSIFWKTIQQNIDFYSNFPHFLSEFTEKSYLELFERKSLVYLTPNAEKQLEYDPNKVYIISLTDGFEKKSYLSILSRKEGIDIRRLPIEKHVFWSGHTKDLKSSYVLSILNDVREGIQWKEAIERNVPKYFIKDQELVQKEENFRLQKLTKQRKALINLKTIFE